MLSYVRANEAAEGRSSMKPRAGILRRRFLLLTAAVARPAFARIECAIGWGQVSDENVPLRVQKVWTRFCVDYCFVMRTTDSEKMEALIGGEWDREEYYKNFFIYGCGGMFGTAPEQRDEEGCSDSPIELTKDYDGRPIPRPVSMPISCCSKQGGCDAALPIFRRHTAWLAALLAVTAAALFL